MLEFLLVVYAMIVFLILLNMLIAMMVASFNEVSKEAKGAWRQYQVSGNITFIKVLYIIDKHEWSRSPLWAPKMLLIRCWKDSCFPPDVDKYTRYEQILKRSDYRRLCIWYIYTYIIPKHCVNCVKYGLLACLDTLQRCILVDQTWVQKNEPLIKIR